MSKKIVITEGSGAAASYVIKELLEHGYNDRIADRHRPWYLCAADFVIVWCDDRRHLVNVFKYGNNEPE